MDLVDELTNKIGNVIAVDTRKITVSVEDEGQLNNIKINDLAIFHGNDATEFLIGIITKVTKKINDDNADDEDLEFEDQITVSTNYCVITLVGTFYTKYGNEYNKFKRAVDGYPEINSEVFRADEKTLPIIMNSLKGQATSTLNIGKFANDKSVDAILDGNKFFQRHAAIVGSTGSGKSYTVVNILERAKDLKAANIILFDLHGEYNELSYAKQIKISDDGGLNIPLWFFNYEEIHSLFIESSEGTSSNQRAAVISYLLEKKKEYINNNMSELSSSIVTSDTQVPFSTNELLDYLVIEDLKEIPNGETKDGKIKTKQGKYYGKLSNLITRLKTKMDDKKYAFVFDETNTLNHTYLNTFIKEIMDYRDNRIKIIDLSEVPSDILPIIIGIITRLVYDVQFWNYPKTKDQNRHPIALICDEAHIYMPSDTTKLKSIEKKSLEIFEKIAKEGRKYGVGMVVVSQRPAELNQTIFSQCNNIMALKITNDRDKHAVAGMLTDSLVGVVDILPNLDVGECIVVGDSILIPTKICLRNDLLEKPKSCTIDFWDRWNDEKETIFDLDAAILNMIKQSGR